MISSDNITVVPIANKWMFQTRFPIIRQKSLADRWRSWFNPLSFFFTIQSYTWYKREEHHIYAPLCYSNLLLPTWLNSYLFRLTLISTNVYPSWTAFFTNRHHNRKHAILIVCSDILCVYWFRERNWTFKRTCTNFTHQPTLMLSVLLRLPLLWMLIIVLVLVAVVPFHHQCILLHHQLDIFRFNSG